MLLSLILRELHFPLPRRWGGSVAFVWDGIGYALAEQWSGWTATGDRRGITRGMR